ncbi:MAG: hypothetical protein H2060_05335 [Azoarcus sp.]|nr:hypothetical protein [Azoarcus sp.]
MRITLLKMSPLTRGGVCADDSISPARRFTCGDGPAYPAPLAPHLLDPVSIDGLKAGETFFVGILPTGLFHQGNWQRGVLGARYTHAATPPRRF